MSNRNHRNTTKSNKNRYYSLISTKYGKMVDNIMNANSYDEIDDILENQRLTFIKEIGYPRNKQIALENLVEAISSAFCVDSPPMEFVNCLRNYPFSLEHALENDTPIYSLRKVYEDLRLEKYMNLEYIPISVMDIMIKHNYYTRHRPILPTKGCNHGDLILSLLGIYSKGILFHEYSKELLVVLFIKNLSLLASSTTKTETTELISHNIFNLLDFALNDTIVKNVEERGDI